MADYIAWYAVELRSRLAPHLPQTKAESIIREAESHLREATERLIAELQLTRESAELAAIDAFGKPEKVALTHLREIDSRVFGVKPIWLVLCGAFVAIWCWDFHWLSLSGPFDNFGDTWQNGLAGLAGFAALVAFVLGCRYGRRSYRLPVLVLGVLFAATSIFAVSAWMITDPQSYEGISRFHMARDLDKIHVTMGKLDRVEAYFREGEKEFAAANSAADLRPEFWNRDAAATALQVPAESFYPALIPMRRRMQVSEVNFYTPRPDVFAMVDGRIWATDTAASFAEAKEAWASDLKHSMASLAAQRTQLQRLVDRAAEAQAGRVFFFKPTVIASVEWCTLTFLPGLLLLEGATFALVRRKRAWPVPGLA